MVIDRRFTFTRFTRVNTTNNPTTLFVKVDDNICPSPYVSTLRPPPPLSSRARNAIEFVSSPSTLIRRSSRNPKLEYSRVQNVIDYRRGSDANRIPMGPKACPDPRKTVVRPEYPADRLKRGRVSVLSLVLRRTTCFLSKCRPILHKCCANVSSATPTTVSNNR